MDALFNYKRLLHYTNFKTPSDSMVQAWMMWTGLRYIILSGCSGLRRREEELTLFRSGIFPRPWREEELKLQEYNREIRIIFTPGLDGITTDLLTSQSSNGDAIRETLPRSTWVTHKIWTERMIIILLQQYCKVYRGKSNASGSITKKFKWIKISSIISSKWLTFSSIPM